MNAMEKKYHSCVWYVNNLIFNLMNINENFRNRREKKRVNLQNAVNLGNSNTKVLKMASNDC